MSKGSTVFRIIAGLLFIVQGTVFSAVFLLSTFNKPFFSTSSNDYLLDEMIFGLYCFSLIPIGILIIANAKKFFSFLFAIPALYFFYCTISEIEYFGSIETPEYLIRSFAYLTSIVLFAPVITNKAKALENLWFIPGILFFIVHLFPYIAYDYLSLEDITFMDILFMQLEANCFLFTGLWFYSDSQKTVPAYQPQPQYVQPQPHYVQSQPQYAQPQPQYAQPQPQCAQPQPQCAQLSKNSTIFRVVAGILFVFHSLLYVLDAEFIEFVSATIDNIIYYSNYTNFFVLFTNLFFKMIYFIIGILIIANAKKIFSYLFLVFILSDIMNAFTMFSVSEFSEAFYHIFNIFVFIIAFFCYCPLVLEKIESFRYLWFLPSFLLLLSTFIHILAYGFSFTAVYSSFNDFLVTFTYLLAHFFTGFWIFYSSKEPVSAFQPQPQYVQPQPQYAQPQPQYYEPYYTQQNYGNYKNAYETMHARPHVVTPRERSIAVAILLQILTCGLYGYYWMAKINNETNNAAGKSNYTSGLAVFFFGILTCGIYFIYWYYKIAQVQNEAFAAHGLPPKDNSVLFLILILFGIDLINLAILQDGLNQMSRTRR